MRNGMRAISAIALAGMALLLTGCAGDGTSTSTQEPDPAGTEASTPGDGANAGGDTACMLGQWALDTADYGAQATAYLVGLGIPLDYLELGGSQTLTFTADVFNIGTDLTADASVLGHPLTVENEWAGSGEWWWDAELDDQMVVTDWAYTVDPTPPIEGAPEIPSLFDVTGSAPIGAVCAADRLTIQGAGAPLIGHFSRIA